MVMGNSERAWEESYDLHFQTRDAQAAVDAMPQWREAMLARAAAEKLCTLAPASADLTIVLSDDELLELDDMEVEE